MSVNTNQHNASAGVTNSEFIKLLASGAPTHSSMWATAFIGDPGSSEARWGGLALGDANLHTVDGWARQNSYYSVAALVPHSDGEGVSRRLGCFARLLVLVVDDADPAAALQCTYVLETSPGKFQIGIRLDPEDPDCDNAVLVRTLVNRLATRGLMSADKSGNNVMRYVRLPVGQNQKQRPSGAFQHRLEQWNPSVCLSLDEAAHCFGVNLDEVKAEMAGAPTQAIDAPIDDPEKVDNALQNIVDGVALHESVLVVTANLVAGGLHPGAVTTHVRKLMMTSRVKGTERWLERYNDIPRAVSTAELKYKKTPLALAIVIDEHGEIHEHPAPNVESLFVEIAADTSPLRATKWVVEGYIETDGLAMLYGPSGAGKSFVAFGIAYAVAAGMPWHGRAVRHGPVFVIAGEGHNGIRKRFAALAKTHGLPKSGKLPLFVSTKAVPLLDDEAARFCAEEIARMTKIHGEPVLVIIDTLARNFGPGDENKQQDASKFIDTIDALIRFPWKCCVMLVHHTGHDMDRARGSSVYKASVSQEIHVKVLAPGKLQLAVTKMKDGEIPPVKVFTITGVDLGQDDEGESISSAILVAEGDPFDVPLRKNRKGVDITLNQFIEYQKDGWNSIDLIAEKFDLTPPMAKLMVGKLEAQGVVVEGDYHHKKLSEKVLDEYSKNAGFSCT